MLNGGDETLAVCALAAFADALLLPYGAIQAVLTSGFIVLVSELLLSELQMYVQQPVGGIGVAIGVCFGAAVAAGLLRLLLVCQSERILRSWLTNSPHSPNSPKLFDTALTFAEICIIVSHICLRLAIVTVADGGGTALAVALAVFSALLAVLAASKSIVMVKAIASPMASPVAEKKYVPSTPLQAHWLLRWALIMIATLVVYAVFAFSAESGLQRVHATAIRSIILAAIAALSIAAPVARYFCNHRKNR